jgi:hypothetical protein
MDLDPQNINHRNDVKVIADRTKPNEEVLDKFQSAQPTGGKPAGKQAAPKGGAQPGKSEETTIEDHEEAKTLNFSDKIKYDLKPNHLDENSSLLVSNIYLPRLEAAIRFDIRYAQYSMFLQQKYDMSKKVLTYTAKLIKRTLHISP